MRIIRRGIAVAILVVTACIALLVMMGGASIAEAKGGSCPQWEGLMRKHGLPVKVFSALAFRESKCQPRAVGWNYKRGKDYTDCRLAPFKQYQKCRAVASFDSGLWQINSTWYSVTKQICGDTPQSGILLNPKCNVAVAKYLYERGGGLSNWGYRSSKGD